MSSVIENSNSAHRSDSDPRTRVWLVKTEDENDAVIVSFVDKDSDEPVGIYLYEPGADPVELDAVGMEGHANEDEWATVTTSQTVTTWGGRLNCGPEHTTTVEDTDWPGDELVTAASAAAREQGAVDEGTALSEAHDALTASVRELVKAVRRRHDASGASSGHPGVFRWCQHAVCQAAQEAAELVGDA